MGSCTGKTKPWLETWDFQPCPSFSWKGRKAENGVNDWSCLHAEASIKVPKVQGLENFQVIKHIHTRRMTHPNSTGTEAPVLRMLPDLTLCISSSSCSSVSFIVSFFLKFIYLFIFGCVGSSSLCEGFLQLRWAGATLHRGARASHCRGLSLRSTGSRRAGSVVVAHGPSCSAACGILPDQGSNPCHVHWQADSQPLRHQGSPCI